MNQVNTNCMTWIAAGIILMSACSPNPTEEPPGVGQKAEHGYAACEPIIAALEEYKEANGSYPSGLPDLVPEYTSYLPEQVNGEPLMYRLTEQGFSLAFAYIGPGMNICTYTPVGGWRCTGAY